MGNCKSCISVQPQTEAILIDASGILKQIKLPITAAEIMLDEPGHVVSQAMQIRRTRRIPAMKADEELSPAKVYLLVPASRINSVVSESEMARIDSACEKRRPKRRSSKVLPTETEGSSDKVEEGSLPVFQGNDTGFTGQRLGKGNSYRQWRPALEPISEGI
ncbi:uncharacterized protein LOC114313422 [Camellia sinensis]|uniref:Uncharacterized protein n=2 Tax=Camellia sinensis TaxID=4442 RepID=A0A7J7FWX6_CAMSI|nr:uncharacterized protein LOC114313422 [Camellia sinensis]KAF5931434.1 hypothetical protein HYC85_032307 [Camellia sinensis]THF99058.1 hypothetical protein TEA_018801 [Camellia sinensis var. sinensis]